MKHRHRPILTRRLQPFVLHNFLSVPTRSETTATATAVSDACIDRRETSVAKIFKVDGHGVRGEVKMEEDVCSLVYRLKKKEKLMKLATATHVRLEWHW